MRPEFFVLLPIGIIAIVLTIVGISFHLERKRRDRVQQLGRELGFDCLTVLPDSLDGWRSRFKLFSSGRKPEATNVLQRQVDDLQVLLFDYAYTTGSGKHQHRHKQTVAVFQSPVLRLPQFRMTPEGWMSRLGELFGGQDIDFDDDPEFSRAFKLSGTQEARIRELLGPEQRAALLTQRKFSVEACDECLIVWTQDHRPAPDLLQTFFEQAFGVYSALKSNTAATGG
jgi:hypothetical protein